MSNTYLTKEEITELQTLRTQEGQLITQLGELEYQLYLLEQSKEAIKRQINNFSQERDKIALRLQEKYGEGSIDIDSGEFKKTS